MPQELKYGFRLGDLMVKPQAGTITRPDGEVHVEPKTMDVLICLAERTGDVTTRQELIDAVWGGSPVADEPLTRCISSLRRYLGDSRQEPRFLETVPKRGYRLIMPVQREQSRAPPPGWRRWLIPTSGAALLLAGLAWWAVDYFGPAPQPSIAVLPFANHSPDKEGSVFFVDGVHDELLARLAAIGSLKVISRTSVMGYRDTTKNLREIGSELGVATILEGSVQRTADQVRISVQLIDAQTDHHLWVQTFDRALAAQNIFAIQSEITRAIANALNTALSPAEQGYVTKIPTQSLEAYDYYLLGRHASGSRDPKSLDKAISFFAQAIAADNRYAPAYSGLADAYLLLSTYGNLSGQDAAAKAKPLIDKALALDPERAEAHASRGLVEWEFLNNLSAAESAFRRAIDLNPNYSTAHMWLGDLLFSQLHIEEAREFRLRALELDPLNPTAVTSIMNSFARMGRYEHATQLGRKYLESYPDKQLIYWTLAWMAEVHGRLTDLARWTKKLVDRQTAPNFFSLALVALYTDLGEYDVAEQWLAVIERVVPDNLYVQWVGNELLWRSDRIEQGYERTKARLANMRLPASGSLSLDQKHALWEAARFELGVGDYRSAVRHLEKISVDRSVLPFPEPLQGYYFLIDLAYGYLKSGAPAKAQPWLEQTIKIMNQAIDDGYSVPSAHFTLGVAYALSNRTDEALSAIRQAVEQGWRRPFFNRAFLLPDNVRQHAEFKRLMARVDSDIARMRGEVQELVSRKDLEAVYQRWLRVSAGR